MDYYSEIKNELLENETTKKAKDYSKNKSDLTHYYNVGRLIIEAQGGEEKSEYGNNLIKEYSKRLTKDLGKGYSERNLYNMRTYYILFSNNEILQPLAAKLSWTHYTIILSLKDSNVIMYYINECIKRNLSKREFQCIIKNKEYNRLDDKTKSKLINKEETTVTDFIKNPIVLSNYLNVEIVTEKLLKKLILEDIETFMKELGDGYSFIGSEYRIRIGDVFNYIDLLLFNYKFNCFVVGELKVTELKKEYIGQIEIYMNYVDKHIRNVNQDKTIGIIICKKDNKLIMEYCSDSRIHAITYEII